MKPTYEELQAQVNHLKTHLNEIIMVAQRCDSWESFPQEPLDVAAAALEATPAACLAQVKAEAIQGFANDVCGNCASGFQVQLSGEADRYVKRILQGGKE